MTHEFDSLENELAALRPVEPSAELADRIGARLEAEATAAMKSNGTRSVPATYWLAPAAGLFGALAAGLIFAVVWWNSRQQLPPADSPLDLPQTTLASALDESLPSVWTYRGALVAPEELNTLLDKHARLAPAPGNPEQTRGFGPRTMDLNSRLGGL